MRYHILRPESRENDYNPSAPLRPDPSQSRLPHPPFPPRDIGDENAGLVCDLILDERGDLEVGDVIILEGGRCMALGSSNWTKVTVPPENLIIH
jgi:hypothetical protein